MRRGQLIIVVTIVAVVASTCDGRTSTKAAKAVEADPTPTDPATKKGRPEPRFISVEEAVERLEPHVDLPIAIPHDRLAGIRNLRGWVVDPKSLGWGRFDGVPTGTLVLRKGKQILIISYGHARFDGCGGRDTALRTDVAGQPALLNVARGEVWGDLIWPVSPRGTSGTYGLAGTFEGWQLVRLAESMKTASSRPSSGEDGC